MPASNAAAAVTLPGVSRETLERLRAYVALLEKWTSRINLVSPASFSQVWRRHILDSAQIFRLLPAATHVLVDLGSGAGLPGLVLAVLGVPEVHLIESDARKCAFLHEAARATGISVQIHAVRIEVAPEITADVVTARALAPLAKLLDYAEPFLKPGGSCYFLKGASVAAEMAAAEPRWRMKATTHRSLSDEAGVVLQLESIARERH